MLSLWLIKVLLVPAVELISQIEQAEKGPGTKFWP